MVLQDTFLFQGTMMDNLKYGKLDATEKQVQMAMNSLMKGRTSFVIAHCLSTIREADTI